MKLATAAEMKELDRRAIEERRIPSIDLMDRAAEGVAQAVLRLHYVESAEAGDENAEAANGAIGKGTHKAKIDVTMEDANEGEQIETD